MFYTLLEVKLVLRFDVRQKIPKPFKIGLPSSKRVWRSIISPLGVYIIWMRLASVLGFSRDITFRPLTILSNLYL